MASDQPPQRKSERRQKNPADIELGQRIRNRRRAIGLSAAECAQALNFSLVRLRNYEQGSASVPSAHLEKIGRILRVPLRYFLNPPEERRISGSYGRRATDEQPTNEELRLMIEAYRAIPRAELRRQLIDLIQTLAINPPPRRPKR